VRGPGTKLIEHQSREGNPEKRKPLLWAIERKLAEDDARPILFYAPSGVCWQPYVKGLTIMVTSIYNGNRRRTSGSTSKYSAAKKSA
jgi:peptide/nickel transport system substrate-binding protein